MVELGDEHRGHAVERRAPLGLEGGQGPVGAERRPRRDHARAVGGAREVADDHAEAVVERHRDAHAVLFRVAEDLAAEEAVVQDVVVRQGRALRGAGGARGVLDVDGVVERQAGLARRELAVPDRRALLEQRRPPVVEHHRLLEGRALGPHPLDDLHVVALAEALREQQQAQPRLVQRVPQLARLVGGVDVDEDRADAGGGVLGDDPFEAVGGPDADPVAAFDPPPQEGLGEGRGGVPELPVGGPVVLRRHHQRLAVAVALDGAAQVLADGLAEQGHRAGAVHVGGQAHGVSLARGFEHTAGPRAMQSAGAGRVHGGKRGDVARGPGPSVGTDGIDTKRGGRTGARRESGAISLVGARGRGHRSGPTVSMIGGTARARLRRGGAASCGT